MLAKAGKLLGRLLMALLLLFVVATAGLVFVATTETGLQWLQSRAVSYLPEGIVVDRVAGTLVGPLDVYGLSISDDSQQLKLESARIEWSPVALLRRRIHLHKLHLTGLHLDVSAGNQSEETDKPFSLPDSMALPIDIQVDEAVLQRAEILAVPDSEVLVIDALSLTAQMDAGAWKIGNLEASGPLFELVGDADLAPQGAYASNADLKWSLQLPDLAALQGTTAVYGDLDMLRIQQQVSAPYNLNATLEVTDVLGELLLSGKIKLNKSELATISGNLPAVIVEAEIDAQGNLDALAYTVKAHAAEPDLGTAVLDSAGRLTVERVQIERLNLTSPDIKGNLSATGDVAFTQGAPVNLQLQWMNLQWPLAGGAEYSSAAGDFSVVGKLEDYQLNGGMSWRVAEAEQSGQLSLRGQGDAESFDLTQLSITGAPGMLDGSGSVVWSPALSVQARLQGNGVNPGAVLREWPGDLNLQVELSANEAKQGLQVVVDTLHVEGSLREQALRLDGSGRYAEARSEINGLRLVSGNTTLQADGQLVGDSLNFRWSLQSSDLSTTIPGAGGAIEGEGTVGGVLTAPLVTARLSGSDLRYLQDQIGRLNLVADIDAAGNHISSLDIYAGSANVAGIVVTELLVNGSGTPASHALEVKLDSDQGQAELGIMGALPPARDSWQFKLHQGRLAYPELAAWTLAEPASGMLSATAQQIEQSCWRSDAARLCATGGNTAAGIRAEFTLENFAMAHLQPLLPPEIRIDSSASGAGRFALLPGGDPELDLKLQTTAGSLMTRDAEGEEIEALAVGAGEIILNLSADSLQASANLPLLPEGRVHVDAAVAPGDGALEMRPLTGSIGLAINDLKLLPVLVPEIAEAQGNVVGNLALSGRLGAPRLDGRVTLQAPLITLDRPGIEVRDIALSLTGEGRNIAVDMQARSGGGTLRTTGDIALAEAATTISLKIKGDAFQVAGSPDARVYASPDLDVRIAAERIDVNGTVTIPKADITPQNLPAGSSAVAVSEDQIIIKPGEDDAMAQQGPALHARVRINVGDPKLRLTDFAARGRNYADKLSRIDGDKVNFEGFGLKSILAGTLLVTQKPGEPALGTGELRVVLGEYKAYGQDLEIQDGQILFAGGPVTEPTLNIKAVRRPAEGVLVGVRVRGPVQTADFRLYSEPSSMTQSEQLSWLVLGRPLDNASAAESSLVAKAALALGMQGGNRLTRDIGDRLGVDEFGLESGDAGQAAFVVGKYLTPKLYVSYGLGLFEPVSTLRLRYFLSSRWQLETQSSGAATGGDVIYSIERGGN